MLLGKVHYSSTMANQREAGCGGDGGGCGGGGCFGAECSYVKAVSRLAVSL